MPAGHRGFRKRVLERREVEKRIYGVGKNAAHGFRNLSVSKIPPGFERPITELKTKYDKFVNDCRAYAAAVNYRLSARADGQCVPGWAVIVTPPGCRSVRWLAGYRGRGVLDAPPQIRPRWADLGNRVGSAMKIDPSRVNFHSGRRGHRALQYVNNHSSMPISSKTNKNCLTFPGCRAIF